MYVRTAVSSPLFICFVLAIPYPRLEPPIFHGSVFLPASGNGTYGNAAGLAGLVLMIVGGVTAVGSILARRANHPSVAGAESGMYGPQPSVDGWTTDGRREDVRIAC